MQNQSPRPLDYRRPTPPSPARVMLWTFVLLIPAVQWLLFELQRMPYRPPVDMNTFLGGTEIFAVRCVMAVLTAVWSLLIVALFRSRAGRR